MKIKILIVLLIMVFSIAPVFAEDGIEVSILNNSISIRGYTITSIAGKVSAGFFSPINETLTSYNTICDNVSVQVYSNGNITNQTFQNNCRLSLNYSKSVALNVNSSYTTIIGDTQLQKNYEDCISLKAQFSTGLDACVKERDKREDMSENYTQCTTGLQICNSEKTTALNEKSKIEQNTKDNENQRWFYGIIGIIVGIVGMGFYTGKIGGAKANRPEEYFNQSQAA